MLNVITDEEFSNIQTCLLSEIGISIGEHKKAMVISRLAKRLKHHRFDKFGQYLNLITTDASEKQAFIDLLTTNETFFFREARHFDYLRDNILPARNPPTGTFRVWSAASSSGEEAYSIAMLLDDKLGTTPWEILGTDINSQVLNKARRGHYADRRLDAIPKPYLRKYCLKGTGPEAGTMLIDRALCKRVRFQQVNLNSDLPELGMFDVVFLRNVLIYFNADTKKKIVSNILEHIKPGGYLFIGHSETLKDLGVNAEPIMPAIYRKPE